MALCHAAKSRSIGTKTNARLNLLMASGVLRSTKQASVMPIIKQYFTWWGLLQTSHSLDNHKEKILMQLKSISALTLMVIHLFAGIQSAIAITPVPAANPKTPGMSSPNVWSPELQEVTVAQGSTPLENPSTATSRFYGYSVDGPMLPAPGDLPSSTHKVEATKTEPDKNTYLVLEGLHGV